MCEVQAFAGFGDDVERVERLALRGEPLAGGGTSTELYEKLSYVKG